MANEDTAAAAQGQTPQPQFGIERIYIKDISLECPQGSEAFGKQWKPRVDMDINNTQNKLADDLYEVVLRITITVSDSDSDEKFYLVEIHQAGTFRVKGVSEQDLRRILATLAPNTLFPYARETIDSLVTKANFPPLRLAPINFDALLAQAIQKQKQAEQSGGTETVQ